MRLPADAGVRQWKGHGEEPAATRMPCQRWPVLLRDDAAIRRHGLHSRTAVVAGRGDSDGGGAKKTVSGRSYKAGSLVGTRQVGLPTELPRVVVEREIRFIVRH